MRQAFPVASSSLGPKTNPSADPSYVYQIQALHESGVFAALCSDDSVRAFHTGGGLGLAWVLPTKHEGVTQLKTQVWDSRALLLTAGRDGAVKVWDQRMSCGGKETGANQKPVVNLKEDKTSAILSLASSLDLPAVATGTEKDPDTRSDPSIQLWDLRSPAKPELKYIESHSDDITELHWNPKSSTTLLSASSDGLVNIYDTSIADEEDALLQIINHGSSVHHANFLSETEVFALSNNELLSIYKRRDSIEGEDEEDEDPPNFGFGDVRRLLGCDYVVDVMPLGGGGLVYAGSHSQRKLDIIPIKSTPAWDFEVKDTIRLYPAHEEEIVRCVHIDQSTGTILTGGEDGFVRMWKANEG